MTKIGQGVRSWGTLPYLSFYLSIRETNGSSETIEIIDRIERAIEVFVHILIFIGNNHFFLVLFLVCYSPDKVFWWRLNKEICKVKERRDKIINCLRENTYNSKQNVRKVHINFYPNPRSGSRSVST